MEHRGIFKQSSVLVVTGEEGSIEPTGTATQRLFAEDTMVLSRFTFLRAERELEIPVVGLQI